MRKVFTKEYIEELILDDANSDFWREAFDKGKDVGELKLTWHKNGTASVSAPMVKESIDCY